MRDDEEKTKRPSLRRRVPRMLEEGDTRLMQLGSLVLLLAGSSRLGSEVAEL